MPGFLLNTGASPSTVPVVCPAFGELCWGSSIFICLHHHPCLPWIKYSHEHQCSPSYKTAPFGPLDLEHHKQKCSWWLRTFEAFSFWGMGKDGGQGMGYHVVSSQPGWFLCVTQSCPTLCNPMDLAHQVPLSMELSRQEYWSGLPFPSPGDLPDPGIKLQSPALHVDSFQSKPPGKIL